MAERLVFPLLLLGLYSSLVKEARSQSWAHELVVITQILSFIAAEYRCLLIHLPSTVYSQPQVMGAVKPQ